MLDGSPYQGYLYAYPHKTAYRPLRPRPELSRVWAAERTEALSLYLHVPFCDVRCGFCNLFTRSRPPAEQVTRYLSQLRRQGGQVRAALGAGATFAQVAFGGGTPTYLTAAELDELFDVAEQVMGVPLARVPVSLETSPATATPDRLALAVARGADRISMGVQSFLDAETRAAVRPQHRSEVDRALAAIRDAGPAVLNLDLIYGIDGQTPDTWQVSLDAALSWRPEELFLYPLYVRPLTGLGRRPRSREDWDADRLELYRQAVAVLTAAGYRQESMRQFRLIAPAGVAAGTASGAGTGTAVGAAGGAGTASGIASPQIGTAAPSGPVSPAGAAAPEYCCQSDGMVGLGCGARSYTTDLHYSFDYAVSVSQVRAVLDDYLSRPAEDFAYAEVGIALNEVERRRRWLIQSLLRSDGLDAGAYRERFGAGHLEDFPQLTELVERGWLEPAGARLTAEGLARADLIGPWLVSGSVRQAMDGYALR